MKSTKIVKAIMSANSALNTAVSGRFYPTRVAPTATFPCVQYQQVSLTPNGQKSGAANTDFARVQINAYGKTYKEAHDTADLIRPALESYSGTISGHVVHHIEFMGAIDQVDDNTGYEGIYSVVMEFMVNYVV